MEERFVITFEQFMAQALHDPQRGYYARRISAVGGRGDFTTAPMLSTAPAEAIAKWARQAMHETQCWNLIEIGPGEGKLAAQILKNLPWHVRRKVSLHLVETSEPLVKHQQTLLGSRAAWHRSMRDALTICNAQAVIFSNELVDAFPVRRFQKTQEAWQELAVDLSQAAHIREILLPPTQLPDSTCFLDSHPIGQWVEVHDSYRSYLHDWLPLWKSGRMLTIDYGSTSQQLYHRRPHGSIRAYLLHQRLEGSDIYQNMGRQDLTADVNFTDLMLWSQPYISQQNLTSFEDFLTTYARQIEPSFLQESGIGTAFQVLEQSV